MEMNGKKWSAIWNMMWLKHQGEVKAADIHITVKPDAVSKTAVFDGVRSRCDANLNTHRAIYLQQQENGAVTEKELLVRLKGEKRLKVNGPLKTADGQPGIAEGKLLHGSLEYDVVFTDLPFYAQACDELYETGGIVTAPIVVTGHKTVKHNLLCAGGLQVKSGAVLEVVDGETLVFSDAHISGELKGFLTGVLNVEDGGMVNAHMIAGKVFLSGNVTLIGMYYADQIDAADNTVVRMKEFGSLTPAMELGKNVMLEFEDAEPLILGMNANNWHVNSGHTGGDAGFVGTNSTGGSWYTSCLKTPADMLGRKWSPELNGGGVLMPEINGIGLLKMEPDLQLKLIGNTEHNYAMLMLNQHPITHIEGAIHIHCVEGVACPPEDVEALDVTAVRETGSDGKQYAMEYSLKNAAYKFHSAEEIAVQAATKAVIMERFKDIDQFSWQYAPQPSANTYTWYGYEAGQVQEHWDGPTGNEKYIVAIHKK